MFCLWEFKVSLDYRVEHVFFFLEQLNSRSDCLNYPMLELAQVEEKRWGFNGWTQGQEVHEQLTRLVQHPISRVVKTGKDNEDLCFRFVMYFVLYSDWHSWIVLWEAHPLVHKTYENMSNSYELNLWLYISVLCIYLLYLLNYNIYI